MSSSGNFSVSCEHLKEKALHALFSLRRHTNLSKLKTALAFEIFGTMISPISHITVKFGVCFKTWDGSQIEKTHLQFCKRYLEVNNIASNIACRSGLGRCPKKSLSIKNFSRTFCIFSLKMRNLSSNNLF